MLTLTRKIGQKIRIGDDIEIVVREIRGRQVRLGISAPHGLAVYREELYQQIQREGLKSEARPGRKGKGKPGGKPEKDPAPRAAQAQVQETSKKKDERGDG